MPKGRVQWDNTGRKSIKNGEYTLNKNGNYIKHIGSLQ